MCPVLSCARKCDCLLPENVGATKAQHQFGAAVGVNDLAAVFVGEKRASARDSNQCHDTWCSDCRMDSSEPLVLGARDHFAQRRSTAGISRISRCLST